MGRGSPVTLLQIELAQPAGFVEMSIGTFQSFAALAQQPLPAVALNPPPIGLYRVARLGLASPVAPAASRLQDVAAEPQVGQRDQRRVAVVALVPDHLGEAGALRHHSPAGAGDARFGGMTCVRGDGIAGFSGPAAANVSADAVSRRFGGSGVARRLGRGSNWREDWWVPVCGDTGLEGVPMSRLKRRRPWWYAIVVAACGGDSTPPGGAFGGDHFEMEVSRCGERS